LSYGTVWLDHDLLMNAAGACESATEGASCRIMPEATLSRDIDNIAKMKNPLLREIPRTGPGEKATNPGGWTVPWSTLMPAAAPFISVDAGRSGL